MGGDGVDLGGCAYPHHARLVAAGTSTLTCMFQGKVVMTELDTLDHIASRVANNEENEEEEKALRRPLDSTTVSLGVSLSSPYSSSSTWASVLQNIQALHCGRL